MKVISLVNLKGGVGKSTVAVNLATALQRHGKRVVLVDADPIGALRNWREDRPDNVDLPDVLAADRPAMLAASVRALAADYVVIDTPANDSALSAKAIGISDIALIVIQPSQLDILGASGTVAQIISKRDLGGTIEAVFLVNRAIAGTKLSKEVIEGEWNEYGIPALETSISSSVDFAQSIADGVSIYQTRNTKGKAEMDLLIKELEKASWL
jgi:chromosome partitioning protein